MKPRKYQFNNSSITIIFGDITESVADVIVSSDDTGISMGGGVSKSLLSKGGEFIQRDAQRKLPATVGDVIVSTAGNLENQKYIFHCLQKYVFHFPAHHMANDMAAHSDLCYRFDLQSHC